MTMTKVFVSYHHESDQWHKERLVHLARVHGSFEDGSVEVGDIDDSLSSETIRQTIRDEYLRDTQVTILLCGAKTRSRKHIDWELKSSMIDGTKNRKSGILVINLPHVSGMMPIGPQGEKDVVHWYNSRNWINILNRDRCKSRYPYMPERIVDNLLMPNVSIFVVPWLLIESRPQTLKWLVDASAKAGRENIYDLRRKMLRQNHNPNLGFGIAY